MNLRGRIERLERRNAGRGCPRCPTIGFLFTTPPSDSELDALPTGHRPAPVQCSRCGRPTVKVIALPDLAVWAAV